MIIAITAKALAGEHERSLSQGINDYLSRSARSTHLENRDLYADKIRMHAAFALKNRSFYLSKPTLVVSCDLPENRECITLPAGATIQLTDAIKGSGVVHVTCCEKLVTMFKKDFERNASPIAA